MGAPRAVPSLPEIADYFDRLYAVLARSAAHASIVKEAVCEELVGQIGYGGESEFARLAEAVSAGPGKAVLDLCSGTGGLAAWLARHTGAHVAGLDCSAVGLRTAVREGVGSGVSFILGDVDQLPFAARSFDGIVCLDGFSYDLESLAAECGRVLRPGGAFAFLVSLRSEKVGEVSGAFVDAGLEAGVEDLTGQATPLLTAWLAAYKRWEHAHEMEVGERYHRALSGEVKDLLALYSTGRALRALVSGCKPKDLRDECKETSRARLTRPQR